MKKYKLECWIEEKYILETCDNQEVLNITDLEKDYEKPFIKKTINWKLYIKTIAWFNWKSFDFKKSSDNSYVYNLFIDSKIKSSKKSVNNFWINICNFHTFTLKSEFIHSKKFNKINTELWRIK